MAWDIAIALKTVKRIRQKNLESFEIEQLEKCIEIFTHLYIDFLNENGEDVFDK